MAIPFLAAAQIATPFIRAALPALINAVPTLGRIFGSGSDVSERNIAAAQIALDIGKQAVGAVNEQQLVEALEDGEKAAAVKNAVEAQYLQIELASEKSVAAAREFSIAYAALKDVRTVLHTGLTFTELLSLVLVVFTLAGAMGVMIWGNLSDEFRGAVVMLMLIGGFTAVTSFWLGSSNGSKVKNEIIADEMNRAKP